MPGEVWVVDASVLGSAFFEENETAAARSFITRETDLVAPALLALEVASIAAKKVWKGLATTEVSDRAVSEVRKLVSLADLTDAIVATAFRLARDHRYSVYDATYLALAMRDDAVVITLDTKFVARASESGHARYLKLLATKTPG